MIKILHLLKTHTFIKHVSTLMTGTAAAQALTIFAAPILSRLYEPEAFGMFALYTSIISVLGVIMTWKYELAIVLPQKDEDAAHLLGLSCLITLVMTGASLVFIGLFARQFEILLGTPGLATVLYFVPASVCAFGLYQSFNYWCTRHKAYKRLAISQVLRNVSVVSTQLTGGLLKLGSVGLIFGQLVGHMVASVVLGKQVWQNDKALLKQTYQTFNYERIKTLAKIYSDFPKYSTPQAFVNSISQNAAPFILAFYFNSVVVGFYALGLKLLQLPVHLVGESVRQVYFQKAAELQNKGESLRPFLIKTTAALGGIAIIPSLTVIAFGPTLFSFVLGDDWYVAGEYARWMVVWLAFAFMNRPAFATAQVLGFQKYLLYYEIVLLTSRTIALIIGSHFFDVLEGIIAYSLTGACFNLLLILGVIKLSKKTKSNVIGV